MEVLNEEYIKTARSKGLKEAIIVVRHAFRNALIPVVTSISLSIPFLIGGAVVTEQIFAWPGIGSRMVTAITNRDYPVIMGCHCTDFSCCSDCEPGTGSDLCETGSTNQLRLRRCNEWETQRKLLRPPTR